MSTVGMPYLGPLSASKQPAAAPATLQRGLTISGVVLFFAGLLVVGSGFSSLRPTIMGLALHPYLIPIFLAMPLVFMARLNEFPTGVLVSLIVFAAMYVFSVFNGSDLNLSEVFKVACTILTTITCALLVRRRGDVVAGALGLGIAVSLLASRGLSDEVDMTQSIMQGANRNAYSLFALPSILLSGYIVLNFRGVPMWIKGILTACTLPPLVVIFMGANRSGYLGAVVIGLMLFWNRRGKGLLLVGLLVSLVVFWISQFGTTVVLNERLRQTAEGTHSDRSRVTIALACLQIGLENPIIGVSPQRVGWEIARRTELDFKNNVLDSHNIFAHVIAASGLICFAALVSIGYYLWTWQPRDGGLMQSKDDPFRHAKQLLRMYVTLFVVRGMFTREILYNPSFAMVLGMCIGMCILAESARRRAAANPALLRPMPQRVA